MRTIVWFRGKDLRVRDHEPLRRAAEEGEVIPLFVMEPTFFRRERAREAPHRMQFLMGSLGALRRELEQLGTELVLVQGPSVEVLPRLAKQWKADRVWAHRRSEPFGRKCDERLELALEAEFRLFDGETLTHPGFIRSRSGKPYEVFTAFKNSFLKSVRVRPPVAAPRHLPGLPVDLSVSRAVLPETSAMGIDRNPRLLEGGERAAHRRLQAFLSGPAQAYHSQRDRLDLEGTSHLSADLKFGTLSVADVWNAAAHRLGDSPSGIAFRTQLLWREFAYTLMWNHPRVLEHSFQNRFLRFPWRFDQRLWEAWTEGYTGFPIVDASARQLNEEGFVHNRARMVSASFLTKHLLIDYRLGESHYMKYLADGDRAQNNMGWQWSAGCGCDAQPYFRLFNPVIQGKKFDPEGEYVRRWIPELKDLPARYIHRPWEAPTRILDRGGVKLGRHYPHPIVDLAEARNRFLELARQAAASERN